MGDLVKKFGARNLRHHHEGVSGEVNNPGRRVNVRKSPGIPRRYGLSETIEVAGGRNDRCPVDAQLIDSTDRAHTVNIDRRSRVDINNLWLAVHCIGAS